MNDTYGHQAGDDALRGITSLLNKALREGDNAPERIISCLMR
ncbi:MAG: diguanylate cyclase [Spirochaetia bacterium]|nr:diguanylate cyclase [Spirochaetia bacterium]